MIRLWLNSRDGISDIPPVMVEKFNSFSRDGLTEIRWLATWGESARSMLALALGFDEF